jgi:hypothetical protein
MKIPQYYNKDKKILAIIMTEKVLKNVTSRMILGCIADACIFRGLEVDCLEICFPMLEDKPQPVPWQTTPLMLQDVVALLTRHLNRVPGGVVVRFIDNHHILEITERWIHLDEEEDKEVDE